MRSKPVFEDLLLSLYFLFKVYLLLYLNDSALYGSSR